MTKRVLGRGLEALIPAARPMPTATATAEAPEPGASAVGATAPAAGVPVTELPLSSIRPNPRQPRHHIDERSLAELETSIRAQGILQPLLVRKVADHYELIAGERRFHAAQRAGLNEVPVVVRDLADAQVLEAALVENLQREDLDPIDEALGYQALIEDLHYTHERVADRVGKDRTTIANALRLLSLPQDVQDLVSRGSLTAGHARALLPLPNAEDVRGAAKYVQTMGFSVRKTEALVARKLKRRIQARRRPNATGSAPGSALADFEDRLRRHFATQVRIVSQGQGGRIEIEYFSQPELERLLETIGVL